MTRAELITNRTQADIDLALATISQNLPLPMDNLKISWDWRALNRIESFCAQLSELLNFYGYAVSITTKTNWAASSIGEGQNGLAVEGLRILENIRLLRNTFFVLKTTPATPNSASLLTFTQANNIEKILFDMDQLIEWMLASFIYSNQAYSGEAFQIAGIRFVGQRYTMGQLGQFTMAQLNLRTMQELQEGWR